MIHPLWQTTVFAVVGALGAEAPPLAFEVASIRPSDPATRGMMSINFARGGTFNAKGATVKSLIALAYGVRDFQISGGPNWINSDQYDITAKPEAGAAADDPLKIVTDEQREMFQQRQRQRLQALLADRFQLKLTHTTKELPVYALVIAKNGPRLQESKQDGGGREGVSMRQGQLTGGQVPMKFLIQILSQNVGRPEIDQTGLSGKYDFKLNWTPEQNQMSFGGPAGGDMAPPVDPSGPSIFTAIQEQLGLKLDSRKGPVEILAIDRVEKPSEN